MALNFPNSPVNGQVYESNGKSWIYNATLAAWELASSSVSLSLNLNKDTVTTTYNIPVGFNGTSAGPITIADNITIEIPDGQSWVIV